MSNRDEQSDAETPPAPREYLLDLAGEAFANKRDREAKEVRRWVASSATDLHILEQIALYLSQWWGTVGRVLAAEKERAAHEATTLAPETRKSPPQNPAEAQRRRPRVLMDEQP